MPEVLIADTQELEAQVATTISRGETLLLLLHRGSAEQAQGVHHMVVRLREDWARLRAEAEHLKAEARREEKEVERFTSLCSGLLVWLAEVERRLEGAVEDALAREAVLREMEGRKEELERTNSLGLELREKGLMEGLEASLTSCNYRWSAARAECRGSKASSPGVKEGRVEAAEITARMGRVGASSPLLLLTPTHLLTSSPPHPGQVREAIAAVETQLRTTVLRGRRFEALHEQEQMLAKVRAAPLILTSSPLSQPS